MYIKFILLAKGGERGLFTGIFGGRGRFVALAVSTVKGTTTSSTRLAIRVDLETITGGAVGVPSGSSSLAR